MMTLVFVFTVECVTHDDPRGQKYRGTMATTESGYTCQKWSSQSPHQHTLLKTEAEILTMNLVCGVTRPIRRKDGIFALYLFAVCNFNLYVISIHNPVD